MRKYVFGPIRSRRLGISLGVDLVPAKTCPLDCIYCEARATTDLTMERKEYVDISEVISELDNTLKTIPAPDFITFSGAGEPTLNSGIGKVISFVRQNYPQIKLCLLTNGLLLNDQKLQEEIADADLVIPSLDASSEKEYRDINRPVSGETLEKLITALINFRKSSSMRFVIEIFIIPGMNDSEESISRFAKLIEKISPDAVQLNTLDRPGVLEDLHPASPEILRKFADALSPITAVETVKPLDDKNRAAPGCELEDTILHLKKLHTADEEIARRCNISDKELQAFLKHLGLQK